MLVNGKPSELISIRDRGLLYGDGVFRTLLATGGQAFDWPLHYKKLQHDCAALDIPCPEWAVLSSELEDLLASYPDGVLKIIITRGQGSRGYTPTIHSTATHIWDVTPIPQYASESATIGIRVKVCHLRLSKQPRLAGIKHLNRLENVLAAAELGEGEFSEGILLDAADNVIEGTRSNLFLVSQGMLITPQLSECGVAGVQRDRVIQWAAVNNMPIEVREVKLNELLESDEVFVVNSIIMLWPIRELNNRYWTTFPVSNRIRQHLIEHEATE